jgi:hypothetical protein
MSPVDEGRVEKIRKLLAKADRAGTVEEAEAFAAKAQELMSKWAIDQALLREKEHRTSEIVTRTIIVAQSNRHADIVLAGEIADANDLFLVQNANNYQPYVKVTGFIEDIESFQLLFTSLLIQLSLAQRKAVRDDYESWQPKSRFVRSFRVGFAREVGDRLIAARGRVVAEYGGDDLLPVLARKKDAVDAAADELYGDSLRRGRGTSVSAAGVAAGRRAGSTADVGFSRVAGARGELG